MRGDDDRHVIASVRVRQPQTKDDRRHDSSRLDETLPIEVLAGMEFASSSDTAGTMMTFSPGFQFTGVATSCFAVSCMESSTRSTSSKLRPVLIG